MKKLITAALVVASIVAVFFAVRRASSSGDPAAAALAAAQKEHVMLVKGNWKALYRSLPDAYQDVVSRIASEVAEKIDAEIFDGAMSVVGAIADVIAEKSGLVEEILAKKMHSPPEAADIATAAKAIKKLSGKLRFRSFKNGDIAAILDHSEFADIAASLLRDEGGASNIPTSSELGDDGLVAIFRMEGEFEHQISIYYEIDGVWIADRYCRLVENLARTAIEHMPSASADAEDKQQFLTRVQAIKLALLKARFAQTASQLEQDLALAFMPHKALGIY